MKKEQIVEARMRGIELILRYALPVLHAKGVLDLSNATQLLDEADLRVAEKIPTPESEIETRSAALQAAKEILGSSLRQGNRLKSASPQAGNL